MMDWQRIAIFIGIGLTTLALLVRWNDFQQARTPIIDTQTTTTSSLPSDGELPTAEPALNDDGIPQLVSERPVPVATTTTASLISVRTDVLDVKIDTLGGDIIRVALPKFAVAMEKPDEPMVLLNRNDNSLYVTRSGLIGVNGTDKDIANRPVFTAAQNNYVLADGSDELVVDLLFQQGEVLITKRHTFTRSDYLVKVQYIIDNQSSGQWSGNFFAQIRRDGRKVETAASGFGMQSFLGVATSTSEKNFDKHTLSDIADARVEHTRTGSWFAMVQHYFLSAWIPDASSEVKYEFRKLSGRDEYLFNLTSLTPTTVAPGGMGEINAGFYVGPKDIFRLDEISPFLELTLDYGPLWFLCKPLFYFLSWLYGFVGNWGVAIVLLTVCVKAAFFHLSATSYRSMAKMRKFAPQMAELKERYGDNRQKLQEEMMKLYKKSGFNPLSGCLPMLVQMPVFLALYWTLMESVELLHAPFVFWIKDLSAQDPYFILPLIYGFTFWVQQKLNPQMGDPMQQKIMQMMPWVFTIFFLFFPAGLVLYWVVNGLLSMLQQWVITKNIEKADAKA